MSGGDQAAVTEPPNVLGDAPFGSYLAGRVAGARNEMDASAVYYRAALENDPDNQTLLERSFSASLSNGRFDEALELAERLSAQANTPSLAPLVLVLEKVRDGRYSKALEVAQSMPKTGFNALIGPLTEAWVLAGMERYDEAMTALDKLSGSASFSSFHHYHQALILSRAGRDEEANTAFQDTLSVAGGASPRTLVSYGRFLAGIGQAEAAASLFEDYLQAIPGNAVIADARNAILSGETPRLAPSPAEGMSDVFFGTAQALNRNGTRGPAVIYAQLARFLQPQSDEVLVLLGSLLEASGQDEASADIFAQVSPSSPLYWEARRNYATMLYRLGETEESMAQLESMRADDPEDLTIAVTLADMYRAEGAPAKALNIYDAIIGGIDTLQENHWSLLYTRGITKERLDDWPGAEADFQTALDLSPEQPLVLNYLGYSWVDRGVHLEKALNYIERAVELRPNDGNIVDSLGWALYKLGRYSEAVEHLERAVLLRPDAAEINDHLGDAYWQVGRILEARFQWSHAIALGAEGSAVDQLEAKLEMRPGENPLTHERY